MAEQRPQFVLDMSKRGYPAFAQLLYTIWLVQQERELSNFRSWWLDRLYPLYYVGTCVRYNWWQDATDAELQRHEQFARDTIRHTRNANYPRLHADLYWFGRTLHLTPYGSRLERQALDWGTQFVQANATSTNPKVLRALSTVFRKLQRREMRRKKEGPYAR